jgi:hypothetical protein
LGGAKRQKRVGVGSKSVDVTVRWGLWNVGLHGMARDQQVEMVKGVMVLEGLDVMAMVETCRGRDEWNRKRSGES